MGMKIVAMFVLYLIWCSDHSWGLEIGSFVSSYLPFLRSSYHLGWYFLFVSSVRPESRPHSSVWSLCFASLSNLILVTYMINCLQSLTLIVTVETGAHLWTGPMSRSMMKRLLYYFQIHVKKSQEKESKQASEQSNIIHVCLRRIYPSSLNFTQVLFSITM